MRNLMYNNMVNAYRNLFWGETVIANLKLLTALFTLKQPPERVLQYMLMI